MVGRLFGMRGFVAGVLVASVVGAGGLAVVRATGGSSLASSFVPMTPVRMVDTRSDLGLVSLVDGVEQRVTIVGSLVPLGATAVSLTVTAVDAGAAGFVSVRPGDATGVPSTSNLNVERGGTIASSVVVKLPTVGDHTGTIKVLFDAMGETTASTDVLIDVIGYYELASTGPAGENGEPGPAGPAGPQGEPGVDATVAITQQSVCDGIDADATADELCKIGMTGPGGGHIFFVDYNDQYAGFNYLEAAPAGWGLGINVIAGETTGVGVVDPRLLWCSDSSTDLGFTGWDKSAVGAGSTNTTALNTTCTTGAIRAASDYAGGTKTDWFLGSIGEMMLMYDNLRKAGVGGFTDSLYWSSSEYTALKALDQDFTSYAQWANFKGSAMYVRPIRAF